MQNSKLLTHANFHKSDSFNDKNNKKLWTRLLPQRFNYS